MELNLLRQLRSLTKNIVNNVLHESNSKLNLSISKAMSSSNKPNSTVDEGDVQRHSVVRDWWDPNGSLKGLHSFNVVRVPFVKDGLVAETEDKSLITLANKKILDIGCGGGILSEGLAKIGAIVTSVDASKDLIKLAKQHSNYINPEIADNKPTYICSTIEEHSKEFPNHYDAVVASEVIEHVADKELFVKCCVEVVKPGGKIFITTPTRSRLTQIWSIYVSEYILNVLPKGTHEYDKLTTPNEVTLLLERNNCHVKILQGISYNPFLNKWQWVNYHTMFFALQASKLGPK